MRRSRKCVAIQLVSSVNSLDSLHTFSALERGIVWETWVWRADKSAHAKSVRPRWRLKDLSSVTKNTSFAMSNGIFPTPSGTFASERQVVKYLRGVAKDLSWDKKFTLKIRRVYEERI